MTKHLSILSWLGAALFALAALGCDQSVSDNPEDGEVATIEVVYGGTIYEVDLASLETITLDDGGGYARLSDIVDAADLGVSPDSLQYDFEGIDGYRPSTRSTCVDHIPTSWETLQGGYVHRTNQNMAWDEELEMPGCSHVDQMLRIHAVGEGELRRSVEVAYGADVVVVDLRTLDRAEIDGTEQVLLSDIVGAAELSTPLASLVFDFVAGDGFRPSSSGNCSEAVPVPGPSLDQGYLSFEGVNLSWDASLGLPNCLSVDDVVRIEASDAGVSGPTVEVSYLGSPIIVDLGDAEVVTFEGTDHVLVSEVLELAALGVEPEHLLVTFEASDGFQPEMSGNCEELFPIVATTTSHAYLELATRNLAWAEEAGVPGCASVDAVVRIHVTDDEISVGPYVDVIYGGVTVTVDLSALEAVSYLGNPHVVLLDVVEVAALGVATADLDFDFIASGGYRASEADTCDGFVPVSGAVLGDGYISLETSDLDWDDAASMPGCSHVNDLAQIEALDPS